MGLPLTGCATRAPQPANTSHDEQTAHWSGRLSLQIEDADRPQAFYAAFDLRGGPLQGQLDLFSPLGSTIARLEWSEGRALLRDGDGVRVFGSMDELLQATTGAALPVTALFQWLAGQQATVPGWLPNLEQLPQGRLSAVRTQPLPSATLHIALDR